MDGAGANNERTPGAEESNNSGPLVFDAGALPDEAFHSISLAGVRLERFRDRPTAIVNPAAAAAVGRCMQIFCKGNHPEEDALAGCKPWNKQYGAKTIRPPRNRGG